jgi:hypothetical protein
MGEFSVKMTHDSEVLTTNAVQYCLSDRNAIHDRNPGADRGFRRDNDFGLVSRAFVNVRGWMDCHQPRRA